MLVFVCCVGLFFCFFGFFPCFSFCLFVFPPEFCKCKDSYKHLLLLSCFFTACLGYNTDNPPCFFHSLVLTVITISKKTPKHLSTTVQKYPNLPRKQQCPLQQQLPPEPENPNWLLDLGRTDSHSNCRIFLTTGNDENH